MYKRFSFLLLLFCAIFTAAIFCTEQIHAMAGDIVQNTERHMEEKDIYKDGIRIREDEVQYCIFGRERIVELECLTQRYVITVSPEEKEILCNIVQAEAGGEDIIGKMLVAEVVVNRVQNDNFPNTVEEVVFQNSGGIYQFSPVGNGTYYDVCVSSETREAVERVLLGEEITDGALYFVAREYAQPQRVEWFDANLTNLFTYGGHAFYK